MTRAESLLHPQGASNDQNNPGEPGKDSFSQGGSLRDAVSLAVGKYLEELDGQIPTDVYPMVLAEIEAPLLTQVMAYTRNNQTKASIMLGLNRGTLRKKLKQYNLIPNDQS